MVFPVDSITRQFAVIQYASIEDLNEITVCNEQSMHSMQIIEFNFYEFCVESQFEVTSMRTNLLRKPNAIKTI